MAYSGPDACIRRATTALNHYWTPLSIEALSQLSRGQSPVEELLLWPTFQEIPFRTMTRNANTLPLKGQNSSPPHFTILMTISGSPLSSICGMSKCITNLGHRFHHYLRVTFQLLCGLLKSITYPGTPLSSLSRGHLSAPLWHIEEQNHPWTPLS